MDKLNQIFKSRYVISSTNTSIIPDLPGVILCEAYDYCYGLDLDSLNSTRIEYWANKIINYYKKDEEFENIPYHKAEVFNDTLILYKKEKETDPEYSLVKVASLKYNFTDYMIFDLDRKKFFVIPKYMIDLLFDNVSDQFGNPIFTD